MWWRKASQRYQRSKIWMSDMSKRCKRETFEKAGPLVLCGYFVCWYCSLKVAKTIDRNRLMPLTLTRNTNRPWWFQSELSGGNKVYQIVLHSWSWPAIRPHWWTANTAGVSSWDAASFKTILSEERLQPDSGTVHEYGLTSRANSTIPECLVNSDWNV